MFYVKGDDMEDMFKKAAENYELNEELAADWNSIQNALQSDDMGIAVAPLQTKKKRRFLFLWWLLLIPAAFLIAYGTGAFKSSSTETAKTKIDKLNITSQQNNNANNTKKDAPKQSNTTTIIQKPSKREIVVKHKDENNEVIVYDNSSKALVNKSKRTSNTNQSEKKISNADDNAVLTNQQTDQSAKANLPQEPNKKIEEKNYTELNSSINTTKNLNKNNVNTQPLINQDSSLTKTVAKSNSSKKKSTTNNISRQAFFYTALTSNIDLSVIKYQKMTAPGYGGGVTFGYHFKNGLSVETGLLYDRKNYYTKGKYFDTKNFKYFNASNSKVINANGNCNMWELPITLNYDFASHKKYTWFISAGVSSYFMHKEYYDFTYEKNGAIMQGGYDYFHTKPDYFSVMNIGAGIKTNLSSKYFLQIQPYYKLPLSKVGIANLSLTSGGINFSISRRFH